MTLIDYLRDKLEHADVCTCPDMAALNLRPGTFVLRLEPCTVHPHAPKSYVAGGFIEPAPRRSWFGRRSE